MLTTTALNPVGTTRAPATGKPAVPFSPVLQDRIFGLPVDREILCTDDRNRFQARIEKRQRRLIAKLPFLKTFLLPGEQVLRVTTALSPLRLAVHLLTGGIFIGREHALLVFTSFRILHIPTSTHYAYRFSLAQIRYRDIRSIRLRLGALRIDYKTGRHETFHAVAHRERGKIRQLLPALPLTKEALAPEERTHLCPHCTRKLVRYTMRCQRCGLAFKSVRLARLMAVMLPGGGHFYLRQGVPGLIFSLLEAGALGIAAWYAGRGDLPILPISAAGAAVLIGWVLVKVSACFHAIHLARGFIPRRLATRGAKSRIAILDRIRGMPAQASS